MPTTHQARARVAALSRYRSRNDADLTAARAELKTVVAADYIRRLVDAAPRLTDEQRSRLASLLRSDVA